MAKPFSEDNGNGLHLHMSLMNSAGENVFDDGHGQGSATLRHAVGGLPAEGNISEDVDPSMPLEWTRAIEALQKSELFSEVFGAEYLDVYCESKRLERDSFNDHISDQEYQWYMF